MRQIRAISHWATAAMLGIAGATLAGSASDDWTVVLPVSTLPTTPETVGGTIRE